MSSRYLFIALMPTCLISSADSYPESEFPKHHSMPPIEEAQPLDTGDVLYVQVADIVVEPEEVNDISLPKLTARQKANLKQGWASIESKEKAALDQLTKSR